MSNSLKEQSGHKTLCPTCEASIRDLYNDHYHHLVMYIKRHFRSGPNHAEDIAQDAFEQLAVAKDLRSVKNIKALLWRIAHNLAVSGIRSNKLINKYAHETEMLFSIDEGCTLTPERILEAKEQMSIVKIVLRTMQERRRRAFMLTRVKGLSHTEAAEIMGISRQAVSKHAAKAAAEIYKSLQTVQKKAHRKNHV